jgi:O-antigen/teichoic acid export membrane protein
MPTISGYLNTFFGAGVTSILIYYLVEKFNPIIAAIIWTLPFTMIFPIYSMHKDSKSNKFLGKYLKTQTYSMFLLVVWLFATGYFLETAIKNDGVLIPMLKGTGVWLIISILYYILVKNHAK